MGPDFRSALQEIEWRNSALDFDGVCEHLSARTYTGLNWFDIAWAFAWHHQYCAQLDIVVFGFAVKEEISCGQSFRKIDKGELPSGRPDRTNVIHLPFPTLQHKHSNGMRVPRERVIG